MHITATLLDLWPCFRTQRHECEVSFTKSVTLESRRCPENHKERTGSSLLARQRRVCDVSSTFVRSGRCRRLIGGGAARKGAS